MAGRIVETEAYLGHDDPARTAIRHAESSATAADLPLPALVRASPLRNHRCANLVRAREAGAGRRASARSTAGGLDVMRRRRGSCQ